MGMSFFNHYKNSFLVDVLEYFSFVTIEERLPANKKCETEEKSDPFLIDWDGPNDPDYPLNWTTPKKVLVVIEIMLMTTITYMGPSIYTPGQEFIQSEFKVGHVTATLNLSLYVLGYGLGPIIFSPLSEIASVGRQQIYIITFFCFAMFQIGCATVDNIGGLIVMRFISGFLCSPPLATGGATIADLFSPEILPPLIGLWSIAAIVAPVVAPLLGASMVVAKNWRWAFWLMLFMCAALLLVVILLFPETSHNNILYRRAVRIRDQTGDKKYYTIQERVDSSIKPKEFIIKTLYRPFKMIVKEPIILTFDFYMALCYGSFYLFFEAFPLVFSGIYHFTLIELGLSYLGFSVGSIIGYAGMLLFLVYVIRPKMKAYTFTPETFLILNMCTGWCFPCALFLFGWGASTHWIVPIIAEVFFIIGAFNMFQSALTYLSISYPKYVASVFAGNGFCRAVFACAFPLFGEAMYNNLAIDGYPVGWGSSIVGFFTFVLALIPFVLYKYGPALRARSSFTD